MPDRTEGERVAKAYVYATGLRCIVRHCRALTLRRPPNPRPPTEIIPQPTLEQAIKVWEFAGGDVEVTHHKTRKCSVALKLFMDRNHQSFCAFGLGRADRITGPSVIGGQKHWHPRPHRDMTYEGSALFESLAVQACAWHDGLTGK
eukprot:8977326-Alexandrium_andersonii.AAC.1